MYVIREFMLPFITGVYDSPDMESLNANDNSKNNVEKLQKHVY